MKTSVGILEKLDLFSTLSMDELKKIHSLAEEVTYAHGETIVKEDAPSDSLFIIKKGCVKITKENQLVVILGEGSAIGEISFIDKGLPSATATVEEDCTLIKIPSSAFDDLMAIDKEIAFKVYRSIALTLCQKLRDTNEWLATKDWLAGIEKEVRSRLHLF